MPLISQNILHAVLTQFFVLGGGPGFVKTGFLAILRVFSSGWYFNYEWVIQMPNSRDT